MDKDSGLSTEDRTGEPVDSVALADSAAEGATEEAVKADTDAQGGAVAGAGAEPGDTLDTHAEGHKVTGELTSDGQTPATTVMAPKVGGRSLGLRRPLARWVKLSAALGAALLVLLVASGVLFVHDRSTADLARQRAAALTAAVQIATDLTSVAPQTAPDQIKALTGESTASYGTQISAYATALQSALRQAQAASRGTVTGAGIENFEPDSASALVIVRAAISSAQVPNAPPVTYRIGMRLQREDNRWLASDIAFVR
jgi:Mce-associated membrane protein